MRGGGGGGWGGGWGGGGDCPPLLVGGWENSGGCHCGAQCLFCSCLNRPPRPASPQPLAEQARSQRRRQRHPGHPGDGAAAGGGHPHLRVPGQDEPAGGAWGSQRVSLARSIACAFAAHPAACGGRQGGREFASAPSLPARSRAPTSKSRNGFAKGGCGACLGLFGVVAVPAASRARPGCLMPAPPARCPADRRHRGARAAGAGAVQDVHDGRRQERAHGRGSVHR